MFVAFLRTLIVYFVIIFAVRMMGKRQIGELQPAELVITILISQLASLPITDTRVPLMNGLLPILILVSVEVIVSGIALRWRWVRKLVSGNSVVIIKDGMIDQQQMRNLRFSIDDLLEQLRISQIFDIQDVDYAVMETTGILSVYQKFDAQAATHKSLNVSPPDEDNLPPALVIADGELAQEGLDSCQKDREWLDSVLKSEGHQLKDVYMMTCDRKATYHIIPKERVK